MKNNDFENFVLIGNIHSPQGVRGEVFVQVFAGEASWVDDWQTLYLAKRGLSTPEKEFSILNKRPHQKQGKWGFALKLEGVSDRNLSEALVGLSVLVPEEFLVSEEGEELFLREVLDFEVIDQERGSIGRVVGFSGNAFQDLLVVRDGQGRDFEVPFVEPIHLETNKDEKTLTMDIPYGLVPGEDL